jgi:hypothetical protein
MTEEKLVPFQVDLRLNVSDGDIMRNLEASKARRLPEVEWDQGSYKSETLVICGSGRSLKETMWGAVALQGHHVMALNGAYSYLLAQEIVPEYFVCLDARKDNVQFVERVSHVTQHLLASQVHPDVYANLELFGVKTFHLATAAVDHVFGDTVLKIGAANTVGLTALTLGCVLGYRNFVLLGYDSSFEDEKSHIALQPWNAEQEVIDVWVKDRKYRTTHAMAQQVAQFLPLLKSLRKQWPSIQVDVRGKGLFYDFVTTNNHETTREKELGKYATAYSDPTYGMSPQRAKALDEALANLAGTNHSYLDISCGRGESLKMALAHGYTDVFGTETVTELCRPPDVIYATLPNTGLMEKCADVVSLVEVIEHLHPDDVVSALHELTRLARKHIIISAATTPHIVGGVDLHPSARSEQEWHLLFKHYWGDKVYRIHDFGFSPAWRVDL